MALLKLTLFLLFRFLFCFCLFYSRLSKVSPQLALAQPGQCHAGKQFMKRQLHDLLLWNRYMLSMKRQAYWCAHVGSFINLLSTRLQWQRGLNNKHLTLPGPSRSYINAKRWNTVKFSHSAVLKYMQNIINLPTLLPALASGRDWSGDRWIRCKWGPKTQRSHIQPAILPIQELRKPTLTRILLLLFLVFVLWRVATIVWGGYYATL